MKSMQAYSCAETQTVWKGRSSGSFIVIWNIATSGAHQSANREVARHRCASDVTHARRQGHRMKLADFRYWHKADIARLSSDVRYWG
jgi:hypothetical protein